MKNLPMDLLRTFITIKDLGGITTAGDFLGRSQPAVSLQLKRLENQLNVLLFHRSGQFTLTEDGKTLYDYARKILEINDIAISNFTQNNTVSGVVKLGIPNDFEVSYLPMMLSKFSRVYPDVALNVSSDLSINLRQEFKKGLYDLIMTMDNNPTTEFNSDEYIVEPLSWVGSSTVNCDGGNPIPLVLYPEGCIYRERIINTLNEANIPWRVLYSSSSLLGIQSALQAGLGISALAVNTIPEDLKSNKNTSMLPPLGEITIGLNYDRNNLSPAASKLLEYLKLGLKHSRNYIGS